MTDIESALLKIEDLSIPIWLRWPLPFYPKSRENLWREMLEEHLPRDYQDELSEVKERHEFSDEQIKLLRVLSEKDYASLLCAEEDASFSSVGLPSPLGLRRLWLGFEKAGALHHQIEYTSKKLKKTLSCSVWKAIYIAYHFDDDLKGTRALIASLPKDELLDFFFRLSVRDRHENSVFSAPFTELARALPQKYIKEASSEVIAWAERNTHELLSMSPQQQVGYDTTLLLAVLETQLGKKDMLSEDAATLFSLNSDTWARSYQKRIVKKVPLAILRVAIERELEGWLHVKEAPLYALGSWFDVAEVLRAFKTPPEELVECVLRVAQQVFEYSKTLAYAYFKGAGILDLFTNYFSLPGDHELIQSHKSWIDELVQISFEETPHVERPQELVDRNTIQSFDSACQAQFLTIGRIFFGSSSLDEMLTRIEERYLAWTRCKMENDAEHRIADAWVARYDGTPIFGLMFLPDQPEPIDEIGFRRDFVGLTRLGTKLVWHAQCGKRMGEIPDVLDDWDSYLISLGVTPPKIPY